MSTAILEVLDGGQLALGSCATVSLNDLPADDALIGEPSKELVASLERYGMLTPILLNGETVIIDGRRRVKAARKAGMDRVPYQTVETDGFDVVDQALSVALHASRKRNMITEYNAVAYLDSHGVGASEIARVTSLSYQQVAALLRYKAIIPELWALFESGAIKASNANPIANLAPEQQYKLLALYNAGERITWKTVRQLRQVQTQDAFDDIDLPDFGDGGAVVPPSTSGVDAAFLQALEALLTGWELQADEAKDARRQRILRQTAGELRELLGARSEHMFYSSREWPESDEVE